MSARGAQAPPNRTRKEARVPESPAKAKWDKENTVKIGLKLNRNTDADILRKLAEVPSKQGYIKQVIREDINMNG